LKQVIDGTLLEKSGRQIVLVDFVDRFEKAADTSSEISRREVSNDDLTTLSQRERQGLDYVQRNGGATRKELEAALGIGTTVAWGVLKGLNEKGKIQAMGNGRDKRYLPTGGG